MDDGVGAFDEAVNDVATLFGFQVNGDGLLALMGSQPHQSESAPGFAAEGFDLDDAQAQVGEDGGAEGGGNPGSEVDDGEAFQRLSGLSPVR